jgi:ribosome recycling factor
MKDDSPSFPKLNYRLKRASSPDQDHPIKIKDITMAELDIDDIQRRMDASLASLHNEFMGLRAGRASTGMLEPIMVDAYGSKMPMNQVGNISAPEPRLLTVSVWDAGMASSVEKGDP